MGDHFWPLWANKSVQRLQLGCFVLKLVCISVFVLIAEHNENLPVIRSSFGDPIYFGQPLINISHALILLEYIIRYNLRFHIFLHNFIKPDFCDAV